MIICKKCGDLELRLEDTKKMYKECLEMFLPIDKWDEATRFLSTYGGDLTKETHNEI